LAQVADQARISVYKTATPAEYLTELKRASFKHEKGWGKRAKYPECFPDVVKLALDKILQSDQAHAKTAGQALRKLARADSEAVPLDLLSADKKKTMILLQEHWLVTVDFKGGDVMHVLTQLVGRDLVAVLVEVLAAKVG